LAIPHYAYFCGKTDGKRIRTDPHALDISGEIRFVAIIPYGHSYAVAALRSGDNIRTVQGNLGHAAAFTLDVYGHVTGTMRQESAARMEKFIQSLPASEARFMAYEAL